MAITPLTTLAGDLTEVYRISRGGRIYDNWMTTLKMKTPPKETHASYPSGGETKGSATWRCVACHGWDYKGTKGTVARDLRTWMGKDPQQVTAILRDPVHRYTPELLPDDAASDVALFLAKGLIEPEKYIDATSGRSRGDAARGAPYFQTICAACHGLDGRKLNFGSDKEPEYLGTEANENPFEVLHKIRNGQPGQEMISLRMLPPEVAADILAYEQTLPVH
ncbi:MAG: c-type cytochrome [Magnetococcales bacterium]|nr:c-type cytochrome [Magnetococcales bacterium]